ncbi:MAG: alpha/beta fold hydrolase [Kofleriaceae bacterium]
MTACQCTKRCDNNRFVAVDPAPFRFDGDGSAAVLCLHGFTSTPFEVRSLGESLQRRGFTAVGPLLPGHGTSASDLDATTWHDWSAAVLSEYQRLAARFDRVAVLGQSMGGLLALHLAAAQPSVAAVATLAAPLWLRPLARRVVAWTRPGAWLHGRLREVRKLRGSDVADPEVKATYPSYQTIPIQALHSLCDFMGHVEAALPRVRQPTLVLHAHQDHTAPVGCARRIAIATAAERLRLLDRSYHLISLDYERDIVAEEVGSFLSRHLQAGAPAA